MILYGFCQYRHNLNSKGNFMKIENVSLDTLAAVTVKSALKSIKSWAANAAQKDQYVHFMACRGLLQFLENGNADILNALVHGAPKSFRKNNLQAWITQHANLKWSKTSGVNKDGGYKQDGDERVVTLEDAIANPFFDMVDKNPTEYNPVSRFSSFVKTFQAKLEKGEIKAKQKKELADLVKSFEESLLA
jgi:hypothetical protein